MLEGGPGTEGGERVILPLQPEPRGYFSAYLPNAAPGTRYRFRLGDDDVAADPASRLQPEGVHGPSQLVDLAAFPWQVDHWPLPPFHAWMIYGLHVGTFTPEGTFEAIIPRLPYLKELGATAIELMPVAQFPGQRNWGYDGVFPYATQNSYGGPVGLQRLVDAAHREGIGVLLDVVYNHLGPEGNVLHRFGPYFTDRYCTPWGDALNYDGPDSDEVRAFFIDSALMWLEEFRVDGFRLDAVHQIYDPHAQPFLAELADAVHERAGELGRPAVLIAESDLNDPKLILPRSIGGYDLDAQWADDFCHALEAQLIGESSSYAPDFGAFAALGKAMREAFVFTGQYSQMRRRHYGRPSEPATSAQFVVFLQNHDQVGNRPGGLRLSRHIAFAQRKLGAATVLLSPYVPLLFMGEEYGEPNPFLYVTDHSDQALIEGVRAGRLADFAHWDWSAEDAAPDPQDIATLERSRLQLDLHGDLAETAAEHRALYQWYRELLALRCALPALTDPEATREVITRDDERVLLMHSLGHTAQSETLALLGFAGAEQRVALPIPAGDWVKRIDAGDVHFLGDGAVSPDRLRSDGAVELTLPPYTALLYERA
jgi:maltooligosyltrehalose trehalohydrolase